MRRIVIGGLILAVLVDAGVFAAGGRGILFQAIYHATGLGAVDRTAQSRLADQVSAKDYGAVGNGVADDTAAINAAAVVTGDINKVILPCPGTYKTTNRGTLSCGLRIAGFSTVNDFGIGDPTAAILVLADGRVSSLPYTIPYARFRFDQLDGKGVQAAASVVGDNQEAVAIDRVSSGTVVNSGVETTAGNNTFRFQDDGLLIEQTRTNFISVPDAPVSQAGLVTNVASYYLRLEGSGSIAVALASGTASGLPCTATASSPCSFAVTINATVNTTVTGSVTFAQLENGQGPTSRIHTASTRQADTVSMLNVLRNGRDWIVATRAQPNGGAQWGPAADDRGLFTIGDSNGQINSANGYYGKDGFLHFQVTDSTTTNKTFNAASVFLGNVEHDFWFYGSADGIMEAWIDGVKVSNTFTGALGTGIITTMPTKLRPCSVPSFAWINGPCKDFRIYYDTTPAKLPQPQWTRTSGVANTVACLGDSLTFGLHVTTPYPSTLQSLLSAGTTGAWSVLNAGVSGDQTWQTKARWGAGVRRQQQQYVVLWSGTNDLANSLLAPTAFANWTEIATQVRTDGKKLIVFTIIPRTGLTTAQNAERVLLNNSIKAYCAAGNATCVDIDPLFDNGDGHTLKAAYDFGDGVHINQAGDDLIAPLVAAVIPH